MRKFIHNRENILIGILLFLTILSRYPVTPHEIGIDSFLIHQITNTISSYGYISWALSPMSLFGLYPMSYPSGMPTLLSIVSQLTGFDTEITILITGYFLAVLGTLAVYIMAKKLSDDVTIAFITAFCFSLAPVFVELTTWTATTRNLFVALFPLLLWALFSYNQTGSTFNRQLLVMSIIFLSLFTTHRSFLLLSLLLIAYLLTKLFWYTKDTLVMKQLMQKLSEKSKIIIFSSVFTILFLLQFTGLKILGNITSFYQAGALAEGNSLPVMLLNFIANYCGQLGLLFPISALGMIIVLQKRDKKFNDILIIFIILITSAFLFLKYYMPLFLLPFISFLIAVAIANSLSRIKNFENVVNKKHLFTLEKIKVFIVIILLLSSLIFSIYMSQRHLLAQVDEYDNQGWLTEDAYSLGFFLKTNNVERFSSDDSVLSDRILASTGINHQRGGFLLSDYFAKGLIKKESLIITPIPLRNITVESNGLYVLIEQPKLPDSGEPISTVLINNKLNDEKSSYSIIYNNGINSILVK